MGSVVYTAIFGNKDEPPQLLNTDDLEDLNVDFVCITDNKSLESSDYKVVYTEPVFEDVTRNARNVKINGFPEIDKYEVAIWHDSSLQLDCAKLSELIAYGKKYRISTFNHKDNCIYSEARSCINNEKESAVKILIQAMYYGLVLKYPVRNGLFETPIMVFNSKYFEGELNKLWWGDLNRFSRRDQISLPVAVWKTDAKVGILPGIGFDNEFSLYRGHRYYHYKSSKLIHSIRFKWLDKLCIWLLYRLEKHLSRNKN